MAYASVAQLKTYLKIGVATDDAMLGDMLARAQSIIERVTNKVYEAAADTTRRFDALRDTTNEGRTLFFDTAWLAEVRTITNGDGTNVSASDYVTEPRNSGPWYALTLKTSAANGVWTFATDPEDAITVVGRWAYSVAAPDYIVQATVRLAAWLYRQKDTAADVDRPLLTSDGVTIMPLKLPADVMSLIEMDIPRGR